MIPYKNILIPIDSLHQAQVASEKALELPASVYNQVWDAEKVKTILTEIDGKYDGETCLLYEDAKKVSQSIITLTPAWLRYDTEEGMLRDVLNLFYCHPTRMSVGG